MNNNNNTKKLLDSVDNAINKKPYIIYKRQSQIIKIIGIFILIIIILTILIVLYKNLIVGTVFNDKNIVHIDKVNNIDFYELSSEKIKLPKNTVDYSINFWLYIKDENTFHNLWRNIFYKGNDPERTTNSFNYTSWDDLSTAITDQSPGLWLHPNSNKLRLAFTVEIDKIYCRTIDDKDKCNNEKVCIYNYRSQECSVKIEHPKQKYKKPEYSISARNQYIVEYIDLPDIPIKKMVNFSFILDNNILNIYINNKLLKIHKFLGTPIFNKGNYYFLYPNSLDCEIYNFKYIPYTISSKINNKLINNIPNTDRFTKLFRFKKYISQIDIKNTISTFF